jgi:hypothetical protein
VSIGVDWDKEMATLTDAERARAQKAEFLRQLGAHAISVEPVENLTDEETTRTAKRKTAEFAVIAYFEEPPEEPLPETLEVRHGNRRLRVPLALRLAPRFRLE